MIFQLTRKNCQIQPGVYKHIQAHLKKIDSILKNFDYDLPFLKITLKKNIDKYHPPKTRIRHTGYQNRKPALSFFEGAIALRTGKKPLYAHFRGQTINEAVDQGFGRIFREIEKNHGRR